MNKQDILGLARARNLAATGRGRAIRLASNLSLREVAASIGTSGTSLWRWETGRAMPQGRPAVAWSALLIDLDKGQSS